ncbi:MAG: hypothetical protein HY553_08170 [Elusimicrobia bacterium]|nr:hypothetical protein [Elusimicrobiota bacterium]
MPESFWSWVMDWLARPGLARLKPRFAAGRASFVSAAVRSARNAPEGGRMFSHYRLSASPVLRGAAGLAELRRRFPPTRDLLVCLSCATCRHDFVIAVSGATDPLGLPPEPGSAAAYPASFTADWFRVWHPDCPGEPELDCPHCETAGRPESRIL